MYIKIIFLFLLIEFSEAVFFGLSRKNTPLRRVTPMLMEANSNFAGAIKQGLQSMPMEVPLNQNDDFMSAMVQADNVSLNVSNIKLTDTSGCKIVTTDAALLILSATTTIYCSAIYFEGYHKVVGEVDRPIFVKLEKVKININYDLKVAEPILVIERDVVKINFTKGSVEAPSIAAHMNDAVFSSLFEKVIQKKTIFYFKKTVGDILKEYLGSINIVETLQNDFYALSTLKSANRGLSQMVNGIAERQQAEFLKSNCKNGFCPVKNMNLTYREQFFLLTYSGKIRLADGFIGDAKTFKKIGSLALFGSPGESRFLMFLKVHVGKAICNFEHMYTTIWGIRFIYLGGVKATINSITAEVAVDVSLDFLGFVAEVNEVVLYIPDMGGLQTQIRSFGLLLGLLASFMQSLVTGLFHSIFVWTFERNIEIMLNETLVGKKISLLG